ncbi:MAG TPA: tetratricopeptide repeat protein [Tepidisphaeraceae bacterium]
MTAYLRSGRVDDARAVTQHFTLNFPARAQGWILSAQLEWKVGRRPAAIEVLSKGLDRLPGSAVLHRQMAMYQRAMGEHERAEAHAERARRGASIRMDADDWLGRVAQDGRLLAALERLSSDSEGDRRMIGALATRLAQAVEDQPCHADRQLALARLQLRTGDQAGALRSVRRALRSNPSYVEALRLHATILGKMGEYVGAIEILRGLVARGCAWADLHVELAELEQARGRDEEARGQLYRAMRINPVFERAGTLLRKWAA